MSDRFDSELDKIGITLSQAQREQFDKYYGMLTEWNKVMNLTAIVDHDEVNIKHFTDSITIVRIKNMDKVASLIDVGTGAGFPGIPLKIVFPHIHVVLLDSLNKRVKFLNAVIDELGLEGISAFHGRAEDFAKKAEFREMFDICVSRAVANLSTLSEYCMPFVKLGGSFISYKSGEAEEEIMKAEKAVELLGGKIDKIDKFVLPETDIGRALIEIEKIRKTPKKFPRKAGMPSKEPIS